MSALCQMLYTGVLVFISEMVERLRNEFRKWKEAIESRYLKINLGMNSDDQ